MLEAQPCNDFSLLSVNVNTLTPGKTLIFSIEKRLLSEMIDLSKFYYILTYQNDSQRFLYMSQKML